MPLSAIDHALAAFHIKRLGHHCNRQNAELLGNLRHDGRRTGAGTTPHAGGDEQHIGTFDDFEDTIPIFHRGLPPDIRICAGTQAFRDIAANLQCRPNSGGVQCLRIRVGANKIDTFDAAVHHMRDSVAAAAAHTDDFDDRTLAVLIH